MRKEVAAQPLGAEILIVCRNIMLASLNFSFMHLKVEILWKFFLYYTNCSFKFTFESLKRYFQWQTPQNCRYLKLSICENLNSEESCPRKVFNFSQVCWQQYSPTTCIEYVESIVCKYSLWSLLVTYNAKFQTWVVSRLKLQINFHSNWWQQNQD